MDHLWEFTKAVGWFWVGSVALLLDAAAAVTYAEWRGLPVWVLGALGFLVILAGAFRAYYNVALERDDLIQQLEAEGPRFKIVAPHLPVGGKVQGEDNLLVPDMHLLNRSATPIELRFSLVAADGSGFLGDEAFRTPPSETDFYANPLHLDAHDSQPGRLAWPASGDLTQFVIPGVALRVVEEQSGRQVDIPLPTQPGGFVYPEA